jgi:hypothetical protein
METKEAKTPPSDRAFSWQNVVVYVLLGATLAGAAILLGWRNTLPRTSFPYPNCSYEGHTLSSVGSFKDMGFLPSFFLPYDSPDDYYLPLSYWSYTHIPPFSEDFFGLVHVAGVDTVHGLRWFSILLNVAALALLFVAMTLLKDRIFGLLMVWAILANPLFWIRAHGLYEYAFQLPHQALLLFGLAVFARTKRNWGLALAFAGAFWQGQCTVVYQLLTYFIILGFLFSGNRRERQSYFLVACAGPLSFAVHILQIVLLNRSFVDAYHDLAASYLQKSSATGPHVRYAAAFHKFPSFGAYLKDTVHYLSYATGVSGYFFFAALVTFAVLAAAAFRKNEPANRANLIRVAFLYAGSWLWFFAMPEVVLSDPAPGLHHLSLWLAVSLVVPLYACGVAAKKYLTGPWWAPPAALALALVAYLLLSTRVDDLVEYRRNDHNILASYTEPARGFEESLWSVGRSEGLTGEDWLALFNSRAAEKDKYARRNCGPNPGLACASPTQGLRLFYWNVLRPRAVSVRLTCGRPGETRVAFYHVGIDQQKGSLLGEKTVADFAGGAIDVPLTLLVAGRVFVMEIGPAACDSYVIEQMIVK